MGCEKYCIKWKNRIEQFQTAFIEFIDQQVLCDVTIVGEGVLFKAHQFVLSACSTYFKNTLKDVCASQHPIIFLRDVSSQEIKYILEYMYKGETVVPRNLMSNFLKTCESLRIYGLCEEEDGSSQEVTQETGKQSQISKEYCNNGEPRLRRNKSDDNDLIQPKQSNVIRKTLSLSNENVTSPNIEKNRNQGQPSLTPSLDLTQVDFPGRKPTNGHCPDDNQNILHSPPHSPQSLIFSVRNPDSANVQHKATESANESLMILPESDDEIVEISDDNTEQSNLNKQPSNADKTLTEKNTDDTDKLEDLNELDQCSDVFELTLSPEHPPNVQDADTDESEVIPKTITINTKFPERNKYKASDGTDYSPGTKDKAIRQAQGLKVVLTKAPVQIHSDSNVGHAPSPSKRRCISSTDTARTRGQTESYQSRTSPDRNLRQNDSRHMYIGGIFESILQVPAKLKHSYCKECRRCIRPVLWKKHALEHSVKFANS